MIVKIPLRKIKLPGGGIHLYTNVFISKSKYTAIIDTGASQSLFHKDNIEELIEEYFETEDNDLSSGVNASLEGHEFVSIKEISIESLLIRELKIPVMNIEHIKNLYKEQFGLDVAGLIGGDILEKYNAVIDYKKSDLLLYKH